MKEQSVFFKGAIPSGHIAEVIANHQSKTSIGAHNIFLGQVRSDVVDGKKVVALDFSTYEKMALDKLREIKEYAFGKYNLKCMHVYHSTGRVEAGEICFVVFISSERRKEVYAATEEVVNMIKSQVPIFGKEIFEDESHQWKVNS